MQEYPHLHLVDGRPLPDVPHHLVPEITEACAVIKARTGCTGYYHQGMRGVQYHVGDEPKGGPAADILFQGDRYLPIVVHKTVATIQRITNKSRQEKDDELDARKRASVQEQYDKHKKLAADLAPEHRDRVKYALRVGENRHSTRVFQVP